MDAAVSLALLSLGNVRYKYHAVTQYTRKLLLLCPRPFTQRGRESREGAG